MADIKPTSFRINDDDVAKFKEFIEKEGYSNQAEAFKSIMQTVEMANAKNMIRDRAKEIETFQDTIDRLMSYYLNSLEINQNSEERIREELRKELQTKDNTISTMYEQIQELKANNEVYKGNEKIKDTIINQVDEEVKKLQKDIDDKNKSIDKLNSNNDLLQEQLQEYKQYKEEYKIIEHQIEELKTVKNNLENNINKYTNDNKQLYDRVKNYSEMVEFYKTNNTELKDNIKALEQEYKQELENTKDGYTKALDERIKINTEQMRNKYDIDIAKKDLEIQKLKNEIEQFKSKPRRAAATKTK